MRTETFAFGSNLWGIGVADEELFPSETVLYVGQIIGLIAADNPNIGAAAAAAVRVEYEPLTPILTLSEAAAAHSTLCDPIVVKKDNRQKNKAEGVTRRRLPSRDTDPVASRRSAPLCSVFPSTASSSR